MRTNLPVAGLLAIGLSSAHAQSQQPPFLPEGTLLQVSAQAEVRRKPDLARISAGVITQATEAQAAMAANAERMQRVVAAIRQAGIADKDIRTTGVHLQPQYAYGENRAPQLTGYQVSNTVHVTVREMERIGPTLDALVAQGANQVNGPDFGIEDEDAVRDQARTEAVQKARRRAQIYAEAAGLAVRRIVAITESGGYAPPTPYPRMAMAKLESADTPVEPGENVVGASIEVWFELR
ncbi:MAG TPA: SIMPL domain-containing protein [Xanthomonadaceae bacterium]|nr:SIMPL domain-containing protein [Xanthomonadaceae bacterium]